MFCITFHSWELSQKYLPMSDFRETSISAFLSLSSLLWNKGNDTLTGIWILTLWDYTNYKMHIKTSFYVLRSLIMLPRKMCFYSSLPTYPHLWKFVESQQCCNLCTSCPWCSCKCCYRLALSPAGVIWYILVQSCQPNEGTLQCHPLSIRDIIEIKS